MDPSPPTAETAAPAAATASFIDQELLKRVAIMAPDRHNAYLLAGQYYDGDHLVKLNDRTKSFLEVNGVPYQENFCETIVDEFTARLQVAGVTTSLMDEEAEEDVLADWLWDYVWDKNRMDAKQGQLFGEAIKKGDAFLLVDFDNERGCPRFTYNRPELFTHIERDDDGKMLYAVKRWDTNLKAPLNPTAKNVTRLNLYFPERVEKYFKATGGENDLWSVWTDPGDEEWPTAWVDTLGQPLGIPVFHVRNRAGGKNWGRSEIANVIPQQNRLNKELVDLAIVLDTMGFPQRYATGVDNTAELVTAPGEVWTSPNPSTGFGQFPEASPEGPLKAVESTLFRMAARSRTPAHVMVLQGAPPSGEALKTAESGIVKKSEGFSVNIGGELSDAFAMAIHLGLVFGEGDKKPPITEAEFVELQINVMWDDPETRNELMHLQALEAMARLGVSRRTLLTMIPDIDADKELEQKQEEDQEAQEQALKFMDSGGPMGAGVRPSGAKPPSPKPKGDIEIEYDGDKPVRVRRK